MASDDKFTCTNNNCNWFFSSLSPMPNHFYSFNLIEQLTSILATRDDLVLLIPGGLKKSFWEFQLEGQVNVYLFKISSSIKELRKA